MNPGNWTRRRLLRALPWSAAPLLLPALPLHAEALTSGGLLPADAPETAKSFPPFSRFTDIAADAGLTKPVIYGGMQNAQFILEITGCGCAFIDYDNDGWMDIFLITGSRIENVPPGATNRLYHNNRDGTFTDVTEKAGLHHEGWGMGVCVGDYNNDGFDDLFVTFYGHNVLYRNNGDGTFTDVTEKAGLLQPGIHYGSGCTFIERNRNGLLDLFVGNYIELDMVHGPRPSMEIPNCNYEGVPVNCGPMGLVPPHHYFFRNNGDGTFTDVSKETGIGAIEGSFALTAVVMDADEDGWPDLFVACDSTFSLMLMNNHDGTFREEALLRGIAVSPDGQRMAGMGVGLCDYDLDGHLDILKTHFYNQPTGLFHNDGKGNFEDLSTEAGIGKEHRYICWGTGLFDLDNDGYPDALIVTGSVYPELEAHFPARFPNTTPRVVFRNLGNGTFVEVGDEAGPGISARHCSRGAAFADFDNDGDLDVLVMNRNEPPSLLRNDSPPENHWIKVRLEGTKSNRSAIGARVIAHYGGKSQAQMVTSQCSYLSVNDPRLHFGLGSEKTADFDIYWPSGAKETHTGLAANKLHTIKEGKGIIPGRPFAK